MLRRARGADSQLEIMAFPIFGFRRIMRTRASSSETSTAREENRADRSVDHALHRDRGRFAAADAQRSDAALQILRFERMQQRDDQARAGGPNGMAERAGAAVDVQLLAGDSEIA